MRACPELRPAGPRRPRAPCPSRRASVNSACYQKALPSAERVESTVELHQFASAAHRSNALAMPFFHSNQVGPQSLQLSLSAILTSTPPPFSPPPPPPPPAPASAPLATRPRAEINLPLLASRCSGSGHPWNDLRPLATKNPPNETATIGCSAPLRLDNLPVEGVSCFKAYVYFPGYDLVSRAAGNNFRWCGNCFSPGKTEARLPFAKSCYIPRL